MFTVLAEGYHASLELGFEACVIELNAHSLRSQIALHLMGLKDEISITDGTYESQKEIMYAVEAEA